LHYEEHYLATNKQSINPLLKITNKDSVLKVGR